MPLFQIANDSLVSIAQADLDLEKRLQALIEKSLRETFNCRFVASEFSTGATHAGRIDTLALSEENNPVIIEYKRIESSKLVTQGLYYLHWLYDHHGDFELVARKVLGSSVEIDWSDIRVICLAPNYEKYDLHAVQVMGANIELWRYRLFANDSLYLEEIYRKTLRATPDTSDQNKDPVMVAAGKKAAITRLTGSYNVEQHFQGKPEHIRELSQAIREFITGLDTAIEEVPKKYYIAYKISQNIACMCIEKRQVTIYLKLNPKTISPPLQIVRDVTRIGHAGTGDTEVSIGSEADLQAAKPLIEKAYRQVGG
jgi:predicted transport protein